MGADPDEPDADVGWGLLATPQKLITHHKQGGLRVRLRLIALFGFMSLRDPNNINVDPDVRDAGKHHYDPAGGCLPNPDPLIQPPAVDEWPSNGSIDDPWDSDCYGQPSSLVTGTRMAYGPGFLTRVSLSSDHNQEMFLDFSFSRPAHLMDNFTIGDIDAAGLLYTYNNFHTSESPGNSFQDEVGFKASMNGTDVPISIFNPGSALTVT